MVSDLADIVLAMPKRSRYESVRARVRKLIPPFMPAVLHSRDLEEVLDAIRPYMWLTFSLAEWTVGRDIDALSGRFEARFRPRSTPKTGH